jgi:hypothetical protein
MRGEDDERNAVTVTGSAALKTPGPFMSGM